MKNLKRILALMLVLVLVLTACGGNSGNSEKPEDNGNETPAPEEPMDENENEEEPEGEAGENETAKGVELDDNSLYLITDLGTIDDKSFNQGSFEGLKKFADEAGVKANYIRPAGEGDQIYLQAIDQAVEAGAKIVATPGYLFESAVGEAQVKYPDVYFVAIDFEPVDENGEAKVDENTTAILYKEEQAGFLAGYAAVKEGYRKLGFMGGVAVPAVIKYGFGFVDGANYAAKELGEKVEVKFNYTGSFVEKPEIKTMAASWFQDGTEIIFSCGGGIYRSIISAASDANAMIIGVDTDQKDEGPQVLTSAMKNLQGSVYDAVKAIVEGDSYEGGKTLVLGVTDDAVQISDDFSRFKNFTEDDYNAVYDTLKNNEDGLTDSIPVIDPSLDQNEQGNPMNILEGLDNVEVEYIK